MKVLYIQGVTRLSNKLPLQILLYLLNSSSRLCT